ncbi:MAG: hypothetical protein ACC742_13060 [Thermoanaerobaculales bacterium]
MLTGKPGVFGLFLLGITVLLPCQTAVTAETRWEWVNPLPQGHHLTAAATGDGVTVAVGLNGSIIASADGLRWKIGNGTTEYDLYEIIWANGRFVAVGSEFEGFWPKFGVILTSTDGFHWVERHRVGSFPIRGVVWDGSRFVAVGGGPLVLLSSDGNTWTEETLGEEISGLGDLVWDGSRFVAVGATSDEMFSYFTSENALTWQSQPLDCECDPAAIAWGNGRYVVVGGAVGRIGTVLTSVDASTWEEQSWEGTGRFHDVIFGREGFVAVGDRGLVATSPDGHTWSFQDPPADFDLWGVTEAGGGYLAVGEDGFMMTSLNGTSWQELSEDTLELYRLVEIHEIANKDGVVVGVGAAGLIVRSVDGGPWLIGPAWTIGDYSSVRRIGSYFWAVGGHGVVRSPNGLDWELMLYDTDVRLFDVAWNGSVYVAVGWSLAPVEGEVAVVTSPDGLEWSYQRLDTGGAVLRAVRWTGSRFVAVGAYGIHLTSPDGFSWTQYRLGEQISLRDMEWNGDRLVAVGEHWETGRLILSSANGVDWEECLPPASHGSVFFDVTWTGARFLAVGRPLGDVIFSSTDGIDWSTETTGTGLRLVSIGGDERMLYATGMGGRIIRRIQSSPAPRRPSGRVSPSFGKKDTVSNSEVRIHRFH